MRNRWGSARGLHRPLASAADQRTPGCRASPRRSGGDRAPGGAAPGSFAPSPRRLGALAARAGEIFGLAGLLLGIAPAAAGSADGPLDEVAAVQSFMHEVESRHGMDGAWLKEVFRDARRQQSILDAFARPAEAKPWHAYREIFVTPARIRGGAAFARENRPVLERVRTQFGVPPEIVAAIIGVETFYGRYTGRFRVIDALSTLAFFAPRRSEFFRRELEQYLLFLREEGRSTADLTGSYAGAIGIPSSFPAAIAPTRSTSTATAAATFREAWRTPSGASVRTSVGTAGGPGSQSRSR